MPSYPAQPWPSMARWMTPNVPALQKAIVYRAYADINIAEHPPGSNRSTSIDAYCRRAHIPEDILASGRAYWCGAWAGCVLVDAGAQVPADFGNCDAWVAWARASKTWYPVVPEAGAAGTMQALVDAGTPLEGFVCMFGNRAPWDSNHCGILSRFDDYRLCIQGNTTLNGYSTNGVLVDAKLLDQTRLLGLIRPTPAT